MKLIEKKLLNYYRDMQDDDQHALLRYAEFLIQQQTNRSIEIAEPNSMQPVENESVVGALKRLSAAYPMLDKAKMLERTSVLMSDHVLRGRAKEDVIKEFEVLFEKQYQNLIRENKSND